MLIDAQHHFREHNAYTDEPSSKPLEEHISDMDKNGIDMAVLSSQIRLAKKVEDFRTLNNDLKDAQDKYPDRFIPLAIVPLNDELTSVEILEDAVSRLEINGVFIRPFQARIDHPWLWKFYEKVCELDVTVFVHPTYPEPIKQYQQYHLGSAVGFMFSTTLAASYAIYSGLLEDFPKLRLVFTHLGGALPFLIHRIDNVYEISDSKIPKRPIEYFKRLYFDTMCYDQEPLNYLCKMVGPEKLLFGTDYGCPWMATAVNIPRSVNQVRKLGISEEDKRKIFGDNAAMLLKVKSSSAVFVR